MNICFIIPPAKKAVRVPERVYGRTFTHYKEAPLPMLYAASVLEAEGHNVTLKDFTDKNSFAEFREYLKTARNGIYILHTVLLAETIDKMAAKEILASTYASIIFFGPHPTLKPKDFLIDKRVYVARGEAEFIIRDIVHAINRNRIVDDIKGISYLKMGEMVETETRGVVEDLDAFPPPMRCLIDDNKDSYFNPKLKERPVALILTSRGCSFKCHYCVPNAISWARELEWKRFNDGKKPPVVLRSPESIAEEFEDVKRLGYKAVSVIDDLFLFGGKERIMEICRRLKDVGLPFGILARCDMILDEEMVSALKDAGCEYVDLGVESMDQDILDDIKKGMDVNTVERAIELLNKYHIEPRPSIMFGSLPLETRESVVKTIEKVSELPVNYCIFGIATPFPGTEFDKLVRENNWAVTPEIDDLEKNLSHTEKAFVNYPKLSKKDLERAIKKANRKFYLTPARILFQLKKISSLKGLKDFIVMWWRVIK